MKRLAGKADDVLRRMPDSPDGHAVLIGADADGFRLFQRGGAPDGIPISRGEGLGARIRAAAGSPVVEVVLDITVECVELAADLVEEEIDVFFLGDDDEPLKVVADGPGLADGPYVEVQTGVLAPLLEADDLVSLLDGLGGRFITSDVGLLGVFEGANVARWRQDMASLAPRLRRLEVVHDEDLAALVAELAPHPVLLFGSVDEARFAALSEIHGGPIVAVALPAGGQTTERLFQLTGGLAAKSVGGFLEALVPNSAPLAVRSLGSDGDGWIARTPGDGPSPVTVMAQGLGSMGLRSPVPTLLLSLFCVLLFGGPAIPLGEFFAGLVGFEPKTWRKLKFIAIGMGPFLPFGEAGLIAFILALFTYWASLVTGWILVRVLRRRPETKVKQTTILVGLCGVAVMAAIVFAAKIVTRAA